MEPTQIQESTVKRSVRLKEKMAEAEKPKYFNKTMATVYCTVRTCSNVKMKHEAAKKSCRDKDGRPVFFYQFPDDKALRQKWIEATGRKLYQIQTKMAICSIHFHKSCFAIVSSVTAVGGKLKLLKKDAIPTLALPSQKMANRVACSPGLVPITRPQTQGNVSGFSPFSTPSLQQLMTLKDLQGGVKVVSSPSAKSSPNQFSNFNVGNNMNLKTVTPVFQKTPQSSASMSVKSRLRIMNDLTQPVVFVETPGKLIVTPACSSAQNRLSSMPNSSSIRVDPNSFFTVQPPNSQKTSLMKKPGVKKIPECSCPTDKFFREGSKQIRILTDHEAKLRSRNVKKARLIKSLQLSRNRGEEKIQDLKRKVKELRRDIERSDRGIIHNPSLVKFFKELLNQHSKPPTNPDAPVRTKYGRETKKFATQLFSQSPEAYKYVREVFNDRLPRPKTISKWLLKAKGSKEEAKRLDLNAERLKQAIDLINAGDSECGSDHDDESVTSTRSSDEDEQIVRQSIRDEIDVVIETEMDLEGNVLNHIPANLEEEAVSDVESDSDFEMTFTTLYDSGPIIPTGTKKTVKPEPGLTFTSKNNSDVKPQTQAKVGDMETETGPLKKAETVVKVNSNVKPIMTPGARFETFAI